MEFVLDLGEGAEAGPLGFAQPLFALDPSGRLSKVRLDSM
jgi:hypothetical protein